MRDEVDRAPARPWSATEPRWNADRMFSSKQRNWEGLAAGRKHLHHGHLLPGSTESTDEDQAGPRAKTCWSEGASPGRSEYCNLALVTEGLFTAQAATNDYNNKHGGPRSSSHTGNQVGAQ